MNTKINFLKFFIVSLMDFSSGVILGDSKTIRRRIHYNAGVLSEFFQSRDFTQSLWITLPQLNFQAA